MERVASWGLWHDWPSEWAAVTDEEENGVKGREERGRTGNESINNYADGNRGFTASLGT